VQLSREKVKHDAAELTPFFLRYLGFIAFPLYTSPWCRLQLDTKTPQHRKIMCIDTFIWWYRQGGEDPVLAGLGEKPFVFVISGTFSRIQYFCIFSVSCSLHQVRHSRIVFLLRWRANVCKPIFHCAVLHITILPQRNREHDTQYIQIVGIQQSTIYKTMVFFFFFTILFLDIMSQTHWRIYEHGFSVTELTQ